MAKRCPYCGSSDTSSGYFIVEAIFNGLAGMAKHALFGGSMSGRDFVGNYHKYYCNKCEKGFN